MEDNIKQIGFTVDSGLINRLGIELVGKAETAVSELIKNAYDADATEVTVEFIDSEEVGGTLIITDNGLGMTEEQLINGFMRISSTDKVHNPKSIKFGRTRAGKKGIGRFATQRLGKKLIITSQTRYSSQAVQVTIDWKRYEADTNLLDIKFPLEYVDKTIEEGTILKIEDLRDDWDETPIKRVFRYTIELFQPDYLSAFTKNNNIAIQKNNSFKVNFVRTTNGNSVSILNDQFYIFDKALARIDGRIENKKGYISIQSDSLQLNNSDIFIGDFGITSNVNFRVYNFVYDRPELYNNKVSISDLRTIKKISNTVSGVKLYRNGFRVLPYGEPDDDWTRLNRRYTISSGAKHPFSNKHLFGYVEITDLAGKEFEETSSREGLIDNFYFYELSDFINKALIKANDRISEGIAIHKLSNKDDLTIPQESDTELLDSTDEVKDFIQDVKDLIGGDKEKQENENKTTDLKLTPDVINQFTEKLNKSKRIIDHFAQLLEETSMLRVLAGLGLTIGEFTHEIKQYKPAVESHIYQLKQIISSLDALNEIEELKSNFDDLFSYTKYFSTTISQNSNREKEPIDILAIVSQFCNTIKADLKQNNIKFENKIRNFNVVSIPMHKSEWSSILFNLYTNSKKAIKRNGLAGKILIEVGNDGENIYLNFQDNGDGIPPENWERVFNAFYSTSTPASFDAPQNEQLTGTGLGLKIVKDIIVSYKGSIFVVEPSEGYNTCFRIKIPLNKKK